MYFCPNIDFFRGFEPHSSLYIYIFLKYDLKWAFSDILIPFQCLFELKTSLGMLKGQIEDKKYFLEWGSNPQKCYFGAIYLQGRNRKTFRLVFGSSENCRICFLD